MIFAVEIAFIKSLMMPFLYVIQNIVKFHSSMCNECVYHDMRYDNGVTWNGAHFVHLLTLDVDMKFVAMSSTSRKPQMNASM